MNWSHIWDILGPKAVWLLGFAREADATATPAVTANFGGFYAEHLRGDLFNACLGVGGLVLGVCTFVVAHMKDNVYDTSEYREWYQRHLKSDPSLKLYGPLERLSQKLVAAMKITLLAGVSHFTLGFIPYGAAALVCVLLTVAAAWRVGNCLITVANNMGGWFKVLHAHARAAGVVDD